MRILALDTATENCSVALLMGRRLIARVPLTPRLTLRQKQSRPAPNGETTPSPLITTRGEPPLDDARGPELVEGLADMRSL